MAEKDVALEEKAQWFVMNAYKSEYKAEEKLRGEGGLEYFIPKRYVKRKFQGKLRRVLVPVIPNLVFVHARYGEIEEFKLSCPFLRYATRRIDGENKIMKVPDGQMNDFIKVAGSYAEDLVYYSPDELDLKKGTRVRVHGGTFDGVEGTLLKVKGKRNKRVVICIKDVTAISVAEFEPELLEVLGEE